jgi:hypothetical protein
MSTKGPRWATPVALLFLFWIAVAACLIAVWSFFRYSVPQGYRNEFLAFKLGLLGVLAAVSTFQWQWWHEFAYRQLTLLHDPAWTVWLRRFRSNPERDAHPVRRGQVAKWLRWRRATARQLLQDTLPPNRTSLATLASTIYLLIVSLLADLVAIFDDPNRLSNAISLGAFSAAVIASIVLWCMHLYSISYEFDGWERSFRSAMRRQRGEP